MSTLILKDFDNYKMYLLKDDLGISKTLFSKNGAKFREKAFMEVIRQSVKPGDICMDIGANIGFVTLQMAKLVGSSGKVYAVEPDDSNFEVLNKNIKVNLLENIVGSDCVAISDTTGSGSFYTSSKSNLGSLFPGKNTDGPAIYVVTLTLDSYMYGKTLPVFYKMDVEGAEVLVLNGMAETAKNSKVGTKILIEVHPREYGKSLDMASVLQRIVGLGFEFRYVISAGEPQPKLFKERGYKPSKVYDCGGPWRRGLYKNVKTEDAIYFCSQLHEKVKIVRSIMLEKM